MARSKKSLKKIKGLLFLMLLTAILAITATYAWFSTQRDVEITGMRLNVEVAESMQISLDGEKWTQSIQIADMRQFYGSYTGTGDSFTIFQAKAIDSTAGTGNNNYVPTELLPVSSAGEVVNGKLQLYTGTYTGSGIDDVAACTETELDTKTTSISDRQAANANHPYLVFDMYLRNISAKTGTNKDTLLLNQYSNVFVNTATTDDTEQEGKGTEGTGLEYSARVGMIVYGNTVSVNATDITTTDEDTGVTTTTTVGEQIRNLTATSTDTAAIWEPNDKEHTAYVLSNTNMTIAADGSVTTLALNQNAVGQDLTNLTSGTYLTGVNTMKPTYTAGTTSTSGVQTATAITDINNQAVGLLPNTISKVRVYVWLEGQDPDCVDLASTGDKLSVNLKLTKEETEDGDGNSYTGAATEGSGSGSGSGSESGGTETTLTAATLNVMTEEEKKNIYGATISNYEPTNGVNDEGIEWRIFHSDGSNIYLIADTYVPRTNTAGDKNYIPTGYDYTSGDYGFDLMAYSNYNGTSDISSTIRTSLMSQFTGYENTEINGKATAYLLDTTAWGGFKDSTYADYAIGGPTLELFTASYNTIHETDIETIVTDDGVGYGYDVRWTGEEYGNYYIEGLDATEDLYLIADTYGDTVEGMWIASPAVSGNDNVVVVGLDNAVFGNAYSYPGSNSGARPVVCLKSSVQIEEQQDGTYKIVE